MKGPGRPDARCRTLLQELSRYLEGELTPARVKTIERHLEACTCCTTMAARLRRTVSACRAAGRQRLPDTVRDRARQRIARLLTGAPADRAASPARRRPRP